MIPHVVAEGGSGVSVGQHPEWHVLGLTINADTVISTGIAAVIVIAFGLYLAAKATAKVPSTASRTAAVTRTMRFFMMDISACRGIRAGVHEAGVPAAFKGGTRPRLRFLLTRSPCGLSGPWVPVAPARASTTSASTPAG